MPELTQVILVDEQDNEIGTAEKMQAHRDALLHRAFSVFILRENAGVIECLLQQRQFDKYHCAGLWTNSCCSHPRPGETIIAAAQRRLQEELGFTTELTVLGSFIYKAEFSNGLTEHELDHVLVGYYHQSKIPYNQTEIHAIRWQPIMELAKAMRYNPSQYTPWLQPALEMVIRYAK